MSTLLKILKCQCPLGLVAHFYIALYDPETEQSEVCQCPHGLVAHFYGENGEIEFKPKGIVSMPSRAGSSFLLG